MRSPANGSFRRHVAGAIVTALSAAATAIGIEHRDRHWFTGAIPRTSLSKTARNNPAAPYVGENAVAGGQSPLSSPDVVKRAVNLKCYGSSI